MPNKEETDISIDEIFNNDVVGDIPLKIKATLKKDRKLMQCLLLLYKINPSHATELSKIMSSKLYQIIDRSNVYYSLSKLIKLNVVSVVKIKDVTELSDVEIKSDILDKHKVFINSLPVAFRKNYSFNSNMKYYWVNQFGKRFIPFCIELIKGKNDT